MKTKSELILPILFLFPFISPAKDSDSTLKAKNQGIEFGVSLGYLVPTGNYSSNTGSNPACATRGAEHTFSLAYRFSKFIGIGIEAGSFENNTNTRYLTSRLGPPPNADAEVSGNTQWMASYYAAGIRLYYPVGKFLFRAGFNAGEIYMTAPQVTLNWGTSGTGGTTGDFRIDNSHCISNMVPTDCFNFSFNANYHLNKRIDFIAQVSYLYAKPEINQTTETYIYSDPQVVSPNRVSYGNVNQNATQTNYLQPISNIGISLGVILQMLPFHNL